MALRKRVYNKKTAFFGSYGWNDGARRDYVKLAEKLKWSILETYDFIGGPSEEDLKKGEEFGERIANLIANSD
jgi:flavorubredoxin